MPYIGAGIQRFNTADGLTVSGSTELDGAVVVNESSADADFRVESNGNANMLFVDAGNDRVGIGTNAPAHDVEIVATAAGSVNDSLQIRNNATSSGTGSRIRFINSTDNTSDANGASISSVRNGNDNDLVFETENATRMTIDHAGDIGIGTNSITNTSNYRNIHIEGTTGTIMRFMADGTQVGQIQSDTNEFQLNAVTSDPIVFKTNNTERMRVDTSGRLIVGKTSSSISDQGTVVTDDGRLDITPSTTNGSGQVDALRLHNSGTTAGDGAGIKFSAGTSTTGAGIFGIGQASNSANLVFRTGGDTERVRIDSSGFLTLPAGGVVSPHVSSSTAGISLAPEGSIRATAVGTQVFEINRIGDGQIGRFREGGTEEGNISVSGTTVSYNGGHLSRYSQFTDGNRIDGLVKGTVMTNLDQMAVWTHNEVLWEEGDDLPDGVSVGDVRTAAYTEDNEQLNCMAVSSVEGDVDVAGVFVNWDDDDEYFTADMNIAMTGDMVIRIAQDTTVARGDLLMSAGDGTAKPQGDDIVRSKTIAKVTSTIKSHTYDDGSYLVPCVLMAC